MKRLIQFNSIQFYSHLLERNTIYFTVRKKNLNMQSYLLNDLPSTEEVRSGQKEKGFRVGHYLCAVTNKMGGSRIYNTG